MKITKRLKSYLRFSLFILLLFILNTIFSKYPFHLDLTQEKRYSLNPKTIQLLKSLDAPINIKIYLKGNIPLKFKNFQRVLRQELSEFQRFASDNIRYKFINPTKSATKKERFKMYDYLHKHGITPIEIKQAGVEKKSETMLFPAAIISYKGKESGVNLLQSSYRYKAGSPENINQSIENLEYEFSNTIRKLMRKKIQKIAFIEGQGELSQLETTSIIKSLSEYYEVDRGSLDGQLNKLNNYKALIIASPIYRFSHVDKYILDQYLMQGGNLLFLLEGVNVRMDSLNNQKTTLAMPMSVNLDDMLFKYGLRINSDLVEDLRCSKIGLSTKSYDNKTEIKWFPWYFFPMLVSPNTHPINKYIDLIRTEFISTIDTVNHTPGVRKTVLLSSSKASRITAVPLALSFQDLNLPPNKASFNHKPLPVAVLLEGKFTSLFKNRIPPLSEKDFKPLNQSKKAKIIVISDGDIIRNIVSPAGNPYPLGFDRYSQYTFKGNTQFLLNALNYLCDDNGLMTVRNREVKLRLLDKTRIKKERTFWQFINIGIPILFLLVGGLLFVFLRKRRYK